MNRLANETSPYLLQHADNPVHWYPWSEEALARARAEDKPIFLSIGYAACHWCHVMAHESFESAEIAALMNQHFVNVKVDREERPDLDSIYMDAVVSMTGNGGWPMSVFLTPDGVPFFGGTYFPPSARHGLPGFPDVLRGVHDAWVHRREAVLRGGGEVLEAVGRNHEAQGPGSEPLSREALQRAVQGAWQGFDWRHAGWGRGPKFPQPMVLEFLLRYHVLTGDPLALEMGTKTLDAMLRGGMYDQLGGGFHRYATDGVWLVPHFEKMLYDNSQLARVYLHAWQITGDGAYRRCVEETLDYVVREMTDPAGGYYSTQDADSEGVEGKFFVWDEAEIDSVLAEESSLFKAAYGVTEPGNFEGANILFAAATPGALAGQYGLAEPEVAGRLEASRRKLFAAREARVRPARDDKVLAGWNGLMMAAFAEAARALGRDDYLASAAACADFLWRELRTGEGRLYRSWRAGQARHNGYLEDYAGIVEGMLALYETTFEARWFGAAQDMAEKMIAHFADPAGGFFDTSDDHEALVVRPKGLQDNAVPSGSALAATGLLKLGALTGEGRYGEMAEDMLSAMQPLLARHPIGFGQWLVALSFALGQPREIAIIGEPHQEDVRRMLAVLWDRYRPFVVTAVGPGAADSPVPLLAGRPRLGDAATAYVCQNFACKQPVNEPSQLRQLLQAEGIRSDSAAA